MQKNETDNNEHKIQYKYENIIEVQQKSTKHKRNKINNETNSDIMSKINEMAKTIDTIISSNKIKVYEKYEDLNEKQLKELLEEKNQNILKLNSQKEQSKNILNSLLQKINTTISDNAEILYSNEINSKAIEELKRILNSKKKELKSIKYICNSCKNNYNYIILKLKKKPELKAEDKEAQVLNLRNENKKLQLDIKLFKDNNICKKKRIKKNRTKKYDAENSQDKSSNYK
jgi:hypothetical protein